MELPQGTRVFVTGGAGMIGVNLIHRLLAGGCRVSVLLRPNGNRVRLRAIEQALDFLVADMTDGEAVRAAVARVKPQAVFHLASTIWARSPSTSSASHLDVNAMGTCHLLEALRDFPSARIVFTGSSSVYGAGSHLREDAPLSPGSVYGASKAAASLLIQTYATLYHMHTIELRLFMPYGPWEHPDRLIPHTILSALAGVEFPMTQGTQQRDLVYVDDVVDALLLAARCPLPPASIFNIGSGVAITVREVVERLLSLMGHPVQARVGALPMRPDEIMEMSADITMAREQLGWQPRTSLDDGLRQSIAWLTEHRDVARQLGGANVARSETVGSPSR